MNLLFKTIITHLRHYRLILLLVCLSSITSYGQNLISVPFNEGFVGDNTANNVSANSKYLTALGWSNVQFTQNSATFQFTAQGNDIPGNVVIKDYLGVNYNIPGYIKWRAPSGGNITTPVFVPTSGATLATNSSNGSATYSITTTSYIGLTYNGQTLTIPTTSSGGTTAGEVTGNAATSGILTSLNAYLGSFPSISLPDYFVVESIGSKIITVSLSATSTQTITVNFNTSNNVAISGTDYNSVTGTLTFAPGETTKTITLTITDDSSTEVNETFYVQLSGATNASILDPNSTITIIDNDIAVGICDANRKYDKIVSGYHSSIALSADGTYLAWGQTIASNGTTDVAPPLVINSTNYSTLTGTVLYTSIGGVGSGGKDQFVALTTTGLWAWGFEGGVFDGTLTSSAAFNKIATPTGGDATTKLPIGVSPYNVTMMVACHQTLLLVANGNVWVLTQASGNIQGDGTALSSTTWHKVKLNASTDLTNVISVRGQVSSASLNAIMALTAEGDVYTWGSSTYLGNATASTAKAYATLMNLPAEFNSSNKPKMIGVTGGVKVTTTTKNTLYVLSANGSLYSLGDNSKKQCGDFTTSERTSWVNVKSNATTNFNNINFISCQEHTAGMPGIAAITTVSNLYSWGENDGLMLGHITSGGLYDPTIPQGFTVGTDKAIFTELGGHTLVYVKEGSTKFCYVGHRTNGSMGESTSTTGNVVAFDCNNTPTINLCGSVSIAASPINSTILANPTSILANGTTTSTITIQLKDVSGTNLTSTGGNINITSSAGTITNIIDNNDGTYTATLTSSNTVETATISYTINGAAGTNTATVNFTAVTPVASPITSTISANPTSILANGTSTSTITVQLKDASGTNFTTSGGTVVITTSAGTITNITDNNDGTYTATLTSSSTVETATISYTINAAAGTNTATVNFTAIPSVATPTITTSGTLIAMSACLGSESAAQSFTVSGIDLTSDIVVTAPTGFEISLSSGTGYAPTLSLATADGEVASTIIYVRLTSSASNGASGDITCVSTGATTQNVATVAAVVSPVSVSGSISGATTVCSGTNSTTLTLSGNTGTIQWQSSTDNSTFTNISGATGQTYTATNLTATTYYQVVATSGSCSSATTTPVSITVDPTSVAGSISGAATVCEGTNSTTLTLSGNTGTIQWQSSTDNSTFTNISGATGQTYTATNLTATTYYQAVVTSGVCASATTTSATITVSPLPSAVVGADATICSGSTFTENGTAANGTIIWITSGTGTYSDATIANPVYTPSAADISAGSVILSMIVKGENGCYTVNDSIYTYASHTLNIVSVLVPTVDAGAASDSICSDTVFYASGTATNGTILWTTSGSGSFSDATIASPIYTPSAADITAGTVTLTMTVISSGVGSCPANAPVSDTVVLTIATPPTADAGSSTVELCAGSNYTLTGTAAHGSILWTTSGNGTFSDATIASPVYTPSVDDIANGSVGLTLTVTGTGGCSVTSDVIQLTFIAAPTVDAGPSTDTICSDSTYTTSATATVGAQLVWSTSGTGTFTNGTTLDAEYTPSTADITAGNVTLTLSVTGSGVCSSVAVTDTIVLTISSAPTSNAGPSTDSICIGSTYTPSGTATNGTILWTTTGTGTFNNVSIATPVYTPSASDIASGSVSLTMTVTGSGSCAAATVSDTVVLTISASPSANAGPATAHICAGANYTLAGTSTNGTVLWTTSGTGTFNNASSNTPVYTPSAADITAGTVTLTMTVSGSAGCSSATATDSVVLTIFKITNTTSQINVACNGGATGSASVTPTGGTTPYTYSWSPSGGTLYSAINLSAGSYSCLVTDANGCTATSSITITEPTVLSGTISQTNVTTFAGVDGTSTVSVSGGTSPYSYSWAPFGGSSATANNLTVGTYSCTIADSNGCVITKTVTLTQPSAFTATISQTNILCNGLSTGSSTVSVSGGVAPITYSWSPTGGSGATASNLVAGTYTCTITDGLGATLTKTVTITQPAALTATTSQTNVAINGNATGSAAVVAAGGSTPYTYTWSPSLGTNASVSGLIAGLYTCVITDANGCTVTKSITITQPTALVSSASQTNVLCNGATTGSATLSVTGGVIPYVYSWSPSVSTGATANNLAAGTYTCTATDANGAVQTYTFTITQPTALTATTSQTNVLCNGATTGVASVFVTGGTAAYSYSWSPSGGTSSTASNLSAGSYTCTITDANGCIITKSFTISQPTALSATVAQTNVTIFGASTGSAGVVVTGGALPYSYSWTPAGGTGATASNLSAGSYTCTITDANGCTLTKSFIITQPSSLVATTSQTNILCNGAATGSASVSVSGGSSTYSYLWSPTGGTSATATNLVAGVYTCSITDSNGALLVKTFTITQPNLLAGITSQTNVSVNGASTGSATVSITGGVLPYTYSWSPSGGASATASNLAAGSYTCIVTDANGCSITKSYTITEPTALTATTSQTNVLCHGATTGVASVTVSGGVSPYTYSWNPSVGTGASISGLSAGTYVCTITDANGAVITRTINVTEPTALSATTSQTNVACNSGSNAIASVVVSGGTAPYTYLWSPTGGTSATANNLVAGTYICTITDANGCILTKTFTITQPTVLSATTSQTNVAINGAATGVASVTVSGGTSSYTYSWSPAGGTSATANNLVAGTYVCTITDANGCVLTKSYTITQPTALIATTTQTNVLCNGASTGAASVNVIGGVGPYIYSWSPSGGTASSASNLTAGTYNCTITDANGAVIIKTITITQSALIPNPIANAGPATDSICAGSSYASSGTATNGSILWTTSGSGTFTDATVANAVYNPSAADVATGSVILTMTVVAPGSCNTPTATDSLFLTIYPTSNAGLISGATSVCQGVNSTTLTLSEYTGTIQWQVSTDNIVFNNIPSQTAQTYTATNLVATTYYRAIVTSGVCSSATTATATIIVSSTSVAGTISGAAPVCYGTNSTTLTLAGNVGTIQWQSSTDNINFTNIVGATTSTYTASNLTVTTYYRTVSTSGVCSAATTSTTIIVNPLPVSNAGPVSAAICAGTSYTTSGVATNGTAIWSTSGSGTFADATNSITTYTPSNADQINGSVVLTMLVTGSASGCSSSTTTDAIVLAINSPVAPSANANQNYCYLNNPTIANLVTTSASNVQWYASPNGGIALSTLTPLVSGATYYASQTVSGCESISRTAVNVTLICSVNAVVDNLTPVNGYTGGTTTSVLSNDLMNGSPLVPSNIILTGVSVPTGFIFNSNGTVTIPPSTPAGNYVVTYSICELLNPSNCSQAIATVVVSPAVIDAVVDNYGMINGFIGSVTTSVLENDLLNGVLVIPSEITLSVVTIPSGLIFNANGTITILPGTAPGIYVVNYIISEILNPNNTDQASAIVTVVDCLAYPVNDCDGDGVTNGQEIIDGTNPSDSCSMVYTNQTVASTSAWNNLDCDGDGVINGQEIIDGTNPTDLCSFVLASQSTTTSANWNNSDCDGDGVRNAQEILDGTNLLDLCSFNSIHITATTSTTWNNLDCDGDGVTNGQEILDGTNPSDSCSLNYIHILVAPSSAWNNLDCDGDGVTNGQEILDGTNPTVSCSFNPANQTVPTSTTWNNIDCDGDGVINGQEITDGTNPFDLCSLNPIHQTVATSTTWNNSDCDGDGVTNNQEVIDNTDLLDSCSFILNHQSVAPSTAWLSTDCDGDGVTNGQEITDGTDLNDSCDSNSIHVSLPQSQLFLSGDCDGDGLSNGEEIGSNPTAPNDFDNDNIPDYLEYNNHTATEDDLEIFNAVTPNGNADNDVFVIRNIQLYPNNTLTIFNRWGVVVYEVDSYGQDNKFFKGISEGRTTLRQLEELPIGTYFYTLRYVNSQGVQKTRSGYLYLNK